MYINSYTRKQRSSQVTYGDLEEVEGQIAREKGIRYVLLCTDELSLDQSHVEGCVPV